MGSYTSSFTGFYKEQYNSLRNLLDDPVGSYVGFMKAEGWQYYVPGLGLYKGAKNAGGILKGNVDTTVSLYSTLGTGDPNEIAGWWGNYHAQAIEVLAIMAVTKGAIKTKGTSKTGTNIVGSKHNTIKPTQEFVNQERVTYYADKLKAGAVVEPIKVVEVPGKGQYIVEGHHRYVASQQTGIPVKVQVVKGQGPIGMSDWSQVQWKKYINEEQFWGD